METFIKKGEYKRLYNNTYLMVDVMDYRGCVIAKFYDTELADEYIAFKMGKNKPVEIPEISDEEIENEAQELFKAGMALEDESPLSYSHKQVCLHEAQGKRAGAKWYRSELKKRMTK